MMELVINQQVDSLYFHLRKHLVQINISKHILKVNSFQNRSHAAYMFIKIASCGKAALFVMWPHWRMRVQITHDARARLPKGSGSDCILLQQLLLHGWRGSCPSSLVSALCWRVQHGLGWWSLEQPASLRFIKMGWISKGDGMIIGRY